MKPVPRGGQPGSSEAAHEDIPARAVNRWYESVMGFSPELVDTLLERLSPSGEGWLLDPFCGAGTSLVQAKKSGIAALGIDANPFMVHSAWAKTRWKVDGAVLLEKARTAVELVTASGYVCDGWAPDVVERGWLWPSVWRQAISLRAAIRGITNQVHMRILEAALAWAVVDKASNVGFGPEAYHVSRLGRISVPTIFLGRVAEMVSDLEGIPSLAKNTPVMVVKGDARNVASLIPARLRGQITAVITSPPYPAEHDYTRITRVELELLGYVSSKEDLRSIKERMLRSNSKTVYSGDNDYRFVKGSKRLRALVRRVERSASKKDYGFARQYPKVLREYFGGLYRHLEGIASVLPRGAKCAYVLGEQCSYFGHKVETASLLAGMLRHGRLPLRVVGIETVRIRKATRGTRRPIKEEALFLERE